MSSVHSPLLGFFLFTMNADHQGGFPESVWFLLTLFYFNIVEVSIDLGGFY